MKTASNLVIIFTLLLWASCSTKKDGDAENPNPTGLGTLTIGSDNFKDFDQDGISNELELKLERSIYRGNFPRFSIVDLKKTQIKFKDLGQRVKDQSVEYKVEDNPNFSIEYNPLREKTARASYARVVGLDDPVRPIGLYDLGILKLSNFNKRQLSTISAILNSVSDNYSDEDQLRSITLNSVFNLKASDLKGIVKIFDIKAELGFIDSEGEFNSITSIFELLSVDRSSAVINSLGYSKDGLSSMEVFLYFERLKASDLEQVFEGDYDLALRINNYKAKTLDGSTFQYSDQIRKALSVGRLFSVSTDKEDYFFFNAKEESIKDTLTSLFGSVKESSQEDLQELNNLVATTDFPIVFESGGNNHLRQNAWHLFSEKSKLSDIPRISSTVMLGFFTNRELASSSERLIQKSRKNVVSSLDLACSGDRECIGNLSTLGILSPEESSIQISDLNIGELVEIRISGENLNWVPGVTTRDFVQVNSSYQVCPSGNYPMPHSNGCERRSNNRQCYYDSRKRTLKKRDLSELTLSSLFRHISLVPRDKGSGVSFSSSDFFNLDKPTLKKDENTWIISFYVTEEIINNYGEHLSLSFPKMGGGAFRSGFLGFDKEQCADRPTFSSEFQTDSLVWSVSAYNDSFIDNAGFTLRNYKVDITRQFKNMGVSHE